MKALEYYWTFCRILHPFHCQKWKQRLLNHVCLHLGVKKSGQLLESSEMSKENALSCLRLLRHSLCLNFWQSKNYIWVVQESKISKHWGICYSFVNLSLVLFVSSVFLSVVALFISDKWLESKMVGIHGVPTFLLILFDWAGNQSWKTCKYWLVPDAWNQWHISSTWNKWHSVVQSKHLPWFIMTWSNLDAISHDRGVGSY